ncbi:hypothetical protein C0W54_04125 [Photobacterium kishitanii]|uniref:hypothetical protein n=1 Tax=Photobacterium kishitanii TaxID=318456 RepID=UPI000D15E2F4|nr:hypothetical protein [Photobacterium kishitanii]PSW62717.1 hypothetical protein C0W54_04125 [Photobacterium kishitanii]
MNNITTVPAQVTTTLTMPLLLAQVNAELSLHQLDLITIKGSYSQFFDYFNSKLAPSINSWIDAVNCDHAVQSNINSHYGHLAFSHYLARQYDPLRWSADVTVMTRGFINITDKKLSFNSINIHHIYDYLVTELIDIDDVKHQFSHLLITDNINYLYRNTPPCIHRYAVDNYDLIEKNVQQNISMLFKLYLKTIATATQAIVLNK